MGLAPAPLNAWPLAWVALIPLWVLLFQDPGPPRSRLAAIAYTGVPALCWGVGYHGLALSWVTYLHPLTWFGVPWLASLVIVLACWIFITLWGAAIVGLWAVLMQVLWACVTQQELNTRLSVSPSYSAASPTAGVVRPLMVHVLVRVLLGTALWCGLETIWSWGPLYWTSLSYTQSPHNLVILHLGRLSGPFTVTAVIVAVNGLLAEAWLQWRRWITVQRSQAGRYPFAYGAHQSASSSIISVLLTLAIAFFMGAHVVGFDLYSRPLNDQPESELRIGLIQGNIPNEVKLKAEGLRRAQRIYAQGYEMLASQGVDAVLTPEGALPVLWREDMQQIGPMYRAIERHQVVAWLGTFGVEGQRITQSLLTLTGAETDPYSRYNKIKLVPLGEYIPFESVLGPVINRLSPLQFSMLKGSPNQRFETPFGRAVVGICYESAFASWFRDQVADGGQFMMTASNNDPYPHAMMMQHHAQDVMRAVEGDRWMVRATNTGYSGIVTPHGQTLWLSDRNQTVIHAATLYRRQTRNPYVRWGDWLTPLLLGAAVAGWLTQLRSATSGL